MNDAPADPALAAAKERLATALRGAADETRALASTLYATPELGFKEHRTSALVAEQLAASGYEVETGLVGTGVRARLDLGAPGPTIAIMGELDALPMPEHPSYDPATGAAHACGHFLQLTHLLSLARALSDRSITAGLGGQVVFLAVPAEEYVDLTWRSAALADGRIPTISGKQALLLDGVFEEVDVAMLCHAGGTNQRHGFTNRAGSAGFLGKRVTFRGRSAHAGRSPQAGVNALQAFTVATTALNATRDATPDAAYSRLHGTITQASSTVSIVPHEVTAEYMLRGRTLETIRHLEHAFEAAMVAGALALGCQLSIETLPGYLPRRVDPQLCALARANAVRLRGEDGWLEEGPASSSTDAGDVSQFLPVLHPNHGGGVGAPHDVGFGVDDWDLATVDPAIVMGQTLLDLLADGGRAARDLVAAYEPTFDADGYRDWLAASRGVRRFTTTWDAVERLAGADVPRPDHP